MSKTPSARSGRAWGYLGTITGGAVSIAANIAHTYVPPKDQPHGVPYAPQFGAVVGAVFWPCALFIAIEILARTDWPKAGRWVLLRMAGLGPVAVVAAIVSYRHLSALLTYYGEDTITHLIGPLAVDGLMVMATGALIATGAGHTRSTTAEESTNEDTADVPEGTPDTPDAIGEASAPEQAPKRPAPKRPARKRPAKPSGVRSDGAVTKAAVAELMSTNPQMSTVDMAEALNISDRTVRRHIASLTAAA